MITIGNGKGMSLGFILFQVIYKWLLEFAVFMDCERSWSCVWKLIGLEKFRLFIWLVLNQALTNNYVCFAHHVAAMDVCQCCSHAEKTPLHCLSDCALAKEVLCVPGFGADACFFHLDCISWVKRNLKLSCNPLFLVTLWWLWRWRNQSVFDGRLWTLQFVIH